MNMKVQRQHFHKASKAEAPRAEAEARSKAGSPKANLPTALAGDGFDAPKAHSRSHVNVDLTGGQPLLLEGGNPTKEVGGTKGKGKGQEREVVNSDLQAFMAEHPDYNNGKGFQTAQDLVNHADATKVPPQSLDGRLRELCEELNLDFEAVSNPDLRSVRLEEYVYSGPVLSDGLHSTTEDAEASFITQFGPTDYNPDGAASTHNCGPTSLAMALRATGNMPEGLSAEEQIDYARALMFPDAVHSTTTSETGQEVKQLDDDGTDTTLTSIRGGAQRSNAGAGANNIGWDNMDAALANGQPVVVNGALSQEWADQFPGDYHQEGDRHMVAILGRTEDGNYIVCDPLHSGGPVEMTREELVTFTGNPDFATVGGGE